MSIVVRSDLMTLTTSISINRLEENTIRIVWNINYRTHNITVLYKSYLHVVLTIIYVCMHINSYYIKYMYL